MPTLTTRLQRTFTDTVKEKAIGQNVLTAVKPSQLMVKIVHDELTQLMGGETAEINLECPSGSNPDVRSARFG